MFPNELHNFLLCLSNGNKIHFPFATKYAHKNLTLNRFIVQAASTLTREDPPNTIS